MTTNDYLDRLLAYYSGAYDIYQPYRIYGKEFAAYGRHFTHNEKYILVPEANMWSADSYEHIIYVLRERIAETDYDEMVKIMEQYMEPELVRKGQKIPEKNHMMSYLTIVLIGQQPLEESLQKKIRKFQFDRGYRFGYRGYSNGRIIAATMADEKVVVSRAVKKEKVMFAKIFGDVHEGKAGFMQLCEEQKVKPYCQVE